MDAQALWAVRPETWGFAVREQLRMGFWIFGAYLVTPAVILLTVS
jgi:hypothetical protein